MHQASLFVALSTQQNIANILPILELANPEDRILWIESETARKNNWSQGACEVLRRYGISNIETLSVDDDPASLQQALAEHEAVRDTGFSVKLIGNGGTRPQMLAAFRALNGHLDELLYNHDQQCVLERTQYRNRQPEPVKRHLYARHPVDLLDVLTLNGRAILPKDERCVWPTDVLPELPRYGQDAEHTGGCHGRVNQWAKDRSEEPKKAFSYSRSTQLAPQQANKFLMTVLDACRLDKNTKIKPRFLEDIYNSAHKLDREAWISQEKNADPAEVPDLGRALEDAVSARVVHWLSANPRFARIIQSVWCNVKIGEDHKKEDAIELDTALLLKNGRLLPLECKSFKAELKDMNSRLGELQRSSSRLAGIRLCVPSYPIFAQEGWHQELVKHVDNMRKWRQFNCIEFTLAGQNGESGKTFEDALAAWLEPFLPAV